jgi:D-glycero-beta-D-manno-heptose-7-phosphate kinase
VTVSRAVFDRLSDITILVIGDLMLDRYLWGSVTRISPEAPVPVVDVRKDENRLGGAANVAMNLKALGVKVLLCGCIGKDRYGEEFRQVLASQGFSDKGLLELSTRRTTTKVRVIGNNQQMLRVDMEDKDDLADDERALLQAHLSALLSESPSAIVFEDYDKGLLDSPTIQHTIAKANELGIPVLVDPKFKNFFAYAGSAVFKPNVKELNEALGTHYERGDVAGIQQGITKLRTRMPHQQTLVTLSEHGVLLVDADEVPTHLPAFYRQIVDVSGAGDTVIATLAAFVAAGLPLTDAARLANLAGGLVCEQVGVVPIEKHLLEDEAYRQGFLSDDGI